MDTLEQSFNDFVSDETTNEVIQENLLPDGTWEGVVNSFAARDDMTEFTKEGSPNPFFGKSIYHVCVDLFINGKERKHWVDCTADKIMTKDGSKVSEMTRLGSQFVKATTGKGSGSLGLALESAKSKRLKFVISHSEGSNGYKPRNWTSVKAVKA